MLIMSIKRMERKKKFKFESFSDKCEIGSYFLRKKFNIIANKIMILLAIMLNVFVRKYDPISHLSENNSNLNI